MYKHWNFLFSVHRYVLGRPDWLHCRGEMIFILKKVLYTILNITSTTAILFIIVMVISSPVQCPRHKHHSTIQVLRCWTAPRLGHDHHHRRHPIHLERHHNHHDIGIQGVPDGVMDTYCWLHSTFTLPHLGVVEIDNVNGVDQVFCWWIEYIDYHRQEPHPGVGPVYDDLSRITEHK